MLHTLTNCDVVLWEEREGDGGFYVVIVGDRRSDGARVEYSADIIYDRISVRPEDESFTCDVDAGDDHYPPIQWTEYEDGDYVAHDVSFDWPTYAMIEDAISECGIGELIAARMRAAAEDETAGAIIADREWSADQPTRGRVWGE